MAVAQPEMFCIADEAPAELLALPAPKSGKRRRTSSAPVAKTSGRALESQLLRKTLLLSWIARLRYLHSACSHPLLQAVALSVWGGFRLSSPSLSELLERFKVSITSKRTASVTPLVDACHAAQLRKGTATDLAICFVALCRALDIPARLVLALDPNDAGANLPASNAIKTVHDGDASQTLATQPDVSDVCAQPGNNGVVDLEDEPSTFQKQLEAMGFARDLALSALLQSESEGAPDILSRATEILLEYEATSRKDRCSRCGDCQIEGSFCGNCGQRVRQGGPSGAADSQKAARARQDDDDAQVVTAWPEAYDLETGKWVAVDLVNGFLAADPRLEWMHRGVPMLWVCSADDGLRGSSGHCVLRDVTARYSPSWWRVEKARGNRAVQRWWEETALHSLSTWQPMHLALADDAASCQGGVAAAEIAADADERDVEALKARRNSDAMPTTKGGMKHDKRYVLKCDLGRHEVLKPGSKLVNLLAGMPVYLRSDVARALSAAQWQKLGRRPRQGEEPCKPAKVRTSAETIAKVTIADGPLFAEWQTEVEDGIVLKPVGNTSTKQQRGVGRFGKAFKAFVAAKGKTKGRRRKQTTESSELSFPALPAPRKAKAKMGLKLAFRMPAFKDSLQKLTAWLDEFGFMPFDKSHSAKERHLGLWVRRAITAFGQRRLSQEQIDLLEKLEQWDWGDTEGGPAMPGEEPSVDSPKTNGKSARRTTAEVVAPDASQDSSMQQWSQLTMQRLAAQLAKQPDMMARRTCLRTWQRIYHPDKNPGRADEVLPIFRWVQSAWDQNFRSNDVASVSEATAQASPPSRSCGPSSGSGEMGKERGGPVPKQEALAAPARKRITGKRPAGNL